MIRVLMFCFVFASCQATQDCLEVCKAKVAPELLRSYSLNLQGKCVSCNGERIN